MKDFNLKDVKTEIAVEVVERLFAKKSNMRVVISPHPVHGKIASCVPYLDLAEALTVPKDTIYKIILRSKRVRKYCIMDIMSTVSGPKPTLCVFEEAILHIIMKLQPSRCQDPEVGERDELNSLTDAELKERLSNDEEFSELYTEYLFELAGKNPEVLKKIRKTIGKVLPGFNFDAKDN